MGGGSRGQHGNGEIRALEHSQRGGAQGRGSAATRAGIWATDVPSCRAPSGTRLVSSAHRARPGVSLSARSTPPSDVASSRLVSSCGESFVASVCTPTLRVSSDGRPAAPAPLLDAQTRRGRIEEGPSSLPPRPWWRDISLTASPSSVAGARARLRPSARCRTTSCSAASSPPASSGPSGSRTPRTGPCATSSPSAHSQTPPSCPGTSVSDHCARPPRCTARAWWSSPVASSAFHGVQLELDKSCACALGFRGFQGFQLPDRAPTRASRNAPARREDPGSKPARGGERATPTRGRRRLVSKLLMCDVLCANTYVLFLMTCVSFAHVVRVSVAPVLCMFVAAQSKRRGWYRTYVVFHSLWHIGSAWAIYQSFANDAR